MEDSQQVAVLSLSCRRIQRQLADALVSRIPGAVLRNSGLRWSLHRPVAGESRITQVQGDTYQQDKALQLHEVDELSMDNEEVIQRPAEQFI